MNYIYDIMLNFNENLYDFYDWNRNDSILHIRRIPIYKVSSIILYDIKNNVVKFDSDFLAEIKNRTEVFTNKGLKNIDYSFLLTDGLETIAISVGKKMKYSKLLIDEELECLEVSNKMKEREIHYKIISTKQRNDLKTRREVEMDNYITQKLNEMWEEKNEEKLKYLYYECFDEKTDNLDKLKQQFKNNLINQEKLYNILKLIQNSK